jgi:hypothetical protein
MNEFEEQMAIVDDVLQEVLAEEREVKFLKSLPADGSLRELKKEELELAHRLHVERKAFMLSGPWPTMMASITFEGRKVLSRAE